MLDAWLIWGAILELKKDDEMISEDTDMLKDLDIGLRLVFSHSGFESSAGFEVLNRLYSSWLQKSLMASDIEKKLKNNEIDLIYAYAIAVLQTVIVTMPTDEREKEEFFKKRGKYHSEFSKRHKEWRKYIEKQGKN